MPSLARNPRIRYSWFVTPSNAGHYRWPIPLDSRNNQFIPDRAGDCQIYYAITDTANGFADTSAYKTAHVKPKLVIDKPRTDTTFWISDAPQMPQIICRAHLAGVDSAQQANLKFNWKIKMEYDNKNLTLTGNVTGVRDWIPSFGANFGGGYVTLDAGVKYGADSLVAHFLPIDSIKVLGVNPTESIARAYLRANYEDPNRARQAEVIGFMESNYRQFRNTGALRGFPLISADNGVGTMQITPPPPVNRNDYWSWHINVDTGKDILQDKWDISNDWFDDWIGLGWPAPTNDNRYYDTYCRYNGGNYYTAVISQGDSIYTRNIIWVDSCGVCDTDNHQADRDSVLHPGCRQSGCCYSDEAMEIH